jgi:hypothetical protein
MKFIQHRSRDILTTYGWIKIKRAYYHCPDCGACLVPYDKASGLGSFSLSPAMADACCMVATDDSFQQVSEKIEPLVGQTVCDDTVRDVVHHTGQVALRQQQKLWDDFAKDRQIPQAEHKPQRLYICPDGTTVHQKDGWHEAKMGCIYWQDQRFQRQKRYVGRFEELAWPSLTGLIRLAVIYGWRLADVVCGEQMRLFILEMWAWPSLTGERRGYVPYMMSILSERHL